MSELSFEWPLEATSSLIVVATATICFVAFHYGTPSKRWSLRGVDAERAVHLQRLGGTLFLGVIPGLVAVMLPGSLEQWGLGLERPLAALGFVMGVGVVILPIIAVASRKPSFRDHYPEMRLPGPWSGASLTRNAASWALYLFAYEFFFRGFLLFSLAGWLGVWPAVFLTTLAYVYAHLHKNAEETIGTIPMGVLFALIALYTGGIWAPFVAHVMIANWADYLASRSAPSESPYSKP